MTKSEEKQIPISVSSAPKMRETSDKGSKPEEEEESTIRESLQGATELK